VIALQGLPIAPGEGHEAGRALLEEMVVAHTGNPMPPIEVTNRGKPYFTEGSLHFSISHSKGHVFCALSDRPIGIDAEEADRAISPALAEKILSPGEYAQWQQAPDPRSALLTFWVLKEAQAKCTGEGLRGYPKDTDFSLADARVQLLHGCLVAVIEGE
jgi:phosphopantetheinyl transferase